MRVCTLVVATALCLAGAAHASLVTNGSFESGLAGWTCTASPGSCGAGTQGGAAQDGAAHFWGFDNAAPPGVLSQSLATEAGATYSISLYFDTNGSVPPNALSLDVGDLSMGLALVQDSWVNFSGTFTASSAVTALDLLFTTVGGSGTVWIDNVVVERVSAAVPEPAGTALVALGLAALGVTRRWRR